MTKPAISVEGLGKLYRLSHASAHQGTFRDVLTNMALAPIRRFRQLRGSDSTMEDFWALKGVSFQAQPGEVVGIVGRNGAGKSTLLKILSRIVEPTEGRIVLRGRVASLLEVGTGFHPELTGRENIFLNGSILGMKAWEIRARFDSIVAFAEVDKFLDTPVKRYSSGMYVRLAFAVAAHLDPEILVVDEVLAVGDAQFQRKCLGKMREIAEGSGRTVLFVSHNMLAIQSLCSRGVLLNSGKVDLVGTASEVVNAYVNYASSTRGVSWKRPLAASHAPLTIDSVEVELLERQPRHLLRCRVRLITHAHYPSAFIAVDFHDSLGTWIMQALPRVEPFILSDRVEHRITVDVDLPPLVPGVYVVGIWVGSSLSDTIDWAREVVQFEILDSPSPGRTMPHTMDRGFCVPMSTVKADAED